MPDPAVDPVPQQRVERRADRQRQVVPVGEVAQGQADQRIEPPTQESVVEQRPHHRLACGLHGGTLPARRCQVLGDRFGDREEHQVDADARGEQHRRPGEQVEGGPGVVRAQPGLAHLGDRDPDDEDQHRHDDQRVVPAEGVSDPGDARGNDRVGRFPVDDRPQGNGQHQQRRTVEHHPVDPGFWWGRLARRRSFPAGLGWFRGCRRGSHGH